MQPIRVVVAKLGHDDHDRGAQVLARGLRDAGMEVVYAGARQTPQQVLATVIQEDAAAVGLSVLSGDPRALIAETVALLRAQDAGDVVVFAGGVIPAADAAALRELGVAEIFPPGSTVAAVTSWARSRLP